MRLPKLLQAVRENMQKRLIVGGAVPQTPRQQMIWQYAMILAKHEAERFAKDPSEIFQEAERYSTFRFSENIESPNPQIPWVPVEAWLTHQTQIYYKLLVGQS